MAAGYMALHKLWVFASSQFVAICLVSSISYFSLRNSIYGAFALHNQAPLHQVDELRKHQHGRAADLGRLQDFENPGPLQLAHQ